MGPRKKCRVCDEAQSKYKCPICLIPYCSLICFKRHKEVPCIKPETSSEEKLKVPCIKPETSSEEKLTSGPVSHVGRPFHVEPSEVLQLHVDEPSEVLQQVQLECIASSSEIRDALKDNELQKLICNIDCSLDAENELNKAMEVEAFRMFTDKLLSTISPQQ